jgi:D-3-phosphoglycerate dehydrogenase
VLAELAPYVALAEKLGKLAVQLVAGGGGVRNVVVSYSSARGDDELDTRLLRAMVTKGLIEPISSAYINIINADFIAKQRGLKITEERQFIEGSLEVPLETIGVRISLARSKFEGALSESGDIAVEGKVKDGIPYLSKVGNFNVDVSLEGDVILCRQVDQPGMIGAVGNILGVADVNISFMSVGRTGPRKQALMAIGIDDKPTEDVLRQIGCISSIEEVVYLKL